MNATHPKLAALTEEQLSALDELVYRTNLVESAASARRGFRVQGKYFFYFHDAQHAARLVALRLASAATA